MYATRQWEERGDDPRSYLSLSSIPTFVSQLASTKTHPVRQRAHTATNRTWIQFEELTLQIANHEALNKLTQQAYAWTVKKRYARYTPPITYTRRILSTQPVPLRKTFCQPKTHSKSSARLMMHFNLGIQGHMQQNLPSLCQREHFDQIVVNIPAANTWYNSFLDNDRISGRPAFILERTFREWRHLL